jgi:hypothetical protein
MVSVFPTSKKFDSDLKLDVGMHPCPPKTHGHGWAWVWAPNVGLCFTLRLRDQWSEYVNAKVDVNVYMDSYMASNGSCFMVTWIVFKNHLLDVGLTQNCQESTTLRMFTTVGLFCFIMLTGPA